MSIMQEDFLTKFFDKIFYHIFVFIFLFGVLIKLESSVFSSIIDIMSLIILFYLSIIGHCKSLVKENMSASKFK